MPLKMRCLCGAGSRWIEQSPESMHPYRVVCFNCGTFAKWGNQAELNRLIESGANGEVVDYEPPTPEANLDAFFE